MDRQKAIIGGIIVVIVIGGGLLYFTMGPGSAASPTATTTDTGGSTSGDTTQNPSQPSAPTVVTDTDVAPTDTTAVVAGTVTPNGSLTSYWYEYGIGNTNTSSTHQSLGSGYAAIPAPAYITGLTKNTTYSFRLVAQNQLGTTRGSVYTFKTSVGTPAPVGTMPTATTVAATSITQTSAKLNGEVNPGKVATRYWFEYGTTADLGRTTALTSIPAGSVNTAVSVSVSNLNSNTTYYFRVNAQNRFGTETGTIFKFKTASSPTASAPAATTIAATSITTTSATLNGTVNPNGGATTYWFESSANPLFTLPLYHTTSKTVIDADAGVVSVSSDVTGLTSGTTYYFRLVAQNSAGITRGDRMTFTTN